MKPKKRQKICHNCEGDVDLDVIVCPFCAADLREERPEQGAGSFRSFAPPFGSEQPISHALYPSSSIKEQDNREDDPVPKQEPLIDTTKQFSNILIPTVLITLGTQLFLFGIILLLFSHKGAFVLKWNANYWFLFCLISAPLVFFGYRALNKPDQ